MLNHRRRHLPLLAGLACLFLASGAAADPADNKYTATATPSLVQPAPAAPLYTVKFINDPAPSADADRATIDPPASFDVLTAPPLSATVSGCGNVAPWSTNVLADETISVARAGAAANNLCPGGTLTVVFAARAAVADGTYTWAVQLRRGDDPLVPPFIIHDPQLNVRVDGTPPNTAIDLGPPTLTNQPSASFSFSSEPGSTFECSVDAINAGAFAACVSPATYSGLPSGARTFLVQAKDLAGNTDPTPASHMWTIDLAPPDTTISSGPPTPTGQTSATFSFSSEPGSTFECSLDALNAGTFAPCASPKTYTGLPGGTRTFQVRAKDAAGNIDPSPASRTWTIDLVGPGTSILTGPPASTNSTSASFTFTASEQGTTFECSLDGALFTQCTAPKAYSGLADGQHRFSVRAIDSTMNTGPEASHTWTVDTRAPRAAVASGPPALTNSRSAAFTFSADEPSSFQCRLDSGALAPCSSPTSYQNLDEGLHTFAVVPTDAVGNPGASAAYGWTIDTTAPQTALGSRPASRTASATATFRFSASEPAAFECKLDAGRFLPCQSPKTYPRLRRSGHTFSVRAIDGAANADLTPAVHRWTITSASALLAPPAGARVASPPLLRWRPVARASYYNVQLYRGRVKVLSVWPTRTRFQLRARWTFLGRQYRLTAGKYSWYVWPRFGRGAAGRYGNAMGESTFTVKASARR